ncbi:MAG: hypothetical protein LIP01_02945, partial [Tannerellaceae bacterium]|nr:hypothetical protein [Tannerellaceae bacterium]
IESFIKDIQYFKTIGFITKEEIETLKLELHRFINDIEQLTLTGMFSTGKRVDFFVTQMTIESSYSYIESKNYNMTYLKLFNLNDAVSSNPLTSIPRIKEWLQSLKKSSSQISVSGELQRIQYFYHQRELINQL